MKTIEQPREIYYQKVVQIGTVFGFSIF